MVANRTQDQCIKGQTGLNKRSAKTGNGFRYGLVVLTGQERDHVIWENISGGQ